jgi:hypothetical protein
MPVQQWSAKYKPNTQAGKQADCLLFDIDRAALTACHP